MKNHWKNILIITNIITLALLILCWSWGNSIATAQGGATGTVQGEGSSQSANNACVQSEDPGDFKFDGPKAKQLVINYTLDHWEDINRENTRKANEAGASLPGSDPSFIDLQNMKDSRCVWFSLSRLKGFIKKIEENAAANMSTGSNKDQKCCETLGIRIYFAEYDEGLVNAFNTENPCFNPEQNYAKKSTLIMIPTFRMSDGKDHDFNPLKHVDCSSPIDTTIWNGIIMALMMNHGGMAPPPFPSGSATYTYNPGPCTEFGNDPVTVTYAGCGADFMIYAVDPTPNPTNPNETVNPYRGQTTAPSVPGNWKNYKQ